MKMFLTLLAGDNALEAEPIFASSNPALIDAVVGRLGLMVDDASRDARKESDEVHEIAATPRPDAVIEAQAPH